MQPVASTDYRSHTCPEADRVYEDLKAELRDDFAQFQKGEADEVQDLLADLWTYADKRLAELHDKNKELRESLREAMDDMATEINEQNGQLRELRQGLDFWQKRAGEMQADAERWQEAFQDLEEQRRGAAA